MPDPKCVLCQRRIRKGRAPPLTGQYAGLCKKCIRQATRARQPLGAADSNSESDSAGSESDCESAWSESGSGSESDGSSGARRRPPDFSVSSQEQQRLEKVGGTGGRHNASREREVASTGRSLSDWASAEGPRVAAGGGGGDGSGATKAATARPKRAQRLWQAERDDAAGVEADAKRAEAKPFDHLANAVGTGKRLVQMELLLPWMEEHLCCRKCSEGASKRHLMAFANFLQEKHATSINFVAETAAFVNSFAKKGGMAPPTGRMTAQSEKIHGFGSQITFECDDPPRPGRARSERTHKAVLTTSYTSEGTAEHPINGNAHDRFEVRRAPIASAVEPLPLYRLCSWASGQCGRGGAGERRNG